jgi:hypothetical protein
LQRSVHAAVDLLHQRRRHVGRAQQRLPGGDIHLRVAAFGKGWNLGRNDTRWGAMTPMARNWPVLRKFCTGLSVVYIST